MSRRVHTRVAAVLAVLLTATACAGAPTQTPVPATVTVHDTPAADARPSSDDPATRAPISEPAAETEIAPAGQEDTQAVQEDDAVGAGGSAVMPDVVCHNLQLAQDEIQEAGVFFSRSQDATGEGRRQVMDRNWVVVAQDPSPGTPIGEGEAVLSVVKIGEPGSC